MSGIFEPFSYKLIYVFRINDEAHAGLLKIGETTLSSDLGPSDLEPCCDLLDKAARKRIDSYTKTALVQYELLYTELAFLTKKLKDGTQVTDNFSDKDIHLILDRSGFSCRKHVDGDSDSEWYEVDLESVKAAIRARKEGMDRIIGKGSKVPDKPPIVLRDEQRAAIDKTLGVFKTEDRMLWDCKMRFGKTVAACELVKEAGFRKVIVVTHRPVVADGWREEHDRIFPPESGRLFLTKETGKNPYDLDERTDPDNDRMLRACSEKGIAFTYFASLQDLRGAKLAGGGYDKNNAVFSMDWDLIIYDEAHEGTLTELGQEVQGLLEAGKGGRKPKVLELSGTPYNIAGKFDDNVFTWDYVMEQKRKREFAETHPLEHNPYAALPELRIYTFDLQYALPTAYRFESETAAFNFKEFFRVWTGDPEKDHRKIPDGQGVGDFVYEDDVRAFLDLITREDEDSHYPFATEYSRDIFRHTFWMVPGVKEARALSGMLRRHPVFSSYGIANVAGDGDAEQDYDDALELVRAAIRKSRRTITISCGRLTTGVTVPEWTAVMMLTGSSSASASGYMQTIFRVQSPGQIDGRQKETAYVFDFAPDRALNVFNEVYKKRAEKGGEDEGRSGVGEFLNFCPVIASDGTRMVRYDVQGMMRQIKKISIEKAVNSGFDDSSVYKDSTGIVMDEEDEAILRELAARVNGGQAASKPQKKVTINNQGLTDEEWRRARRTERKPKKQLTPEEKELASKLKAQKDAREKVIAILRSVSIRLPLLIYGAKKDITEGIRLEDFVTMVDDVSWKEFMPANVDKEFFKKLIKYYDEDVVVNAGLRQRRLARAGDDMMPTQRVQQITEIFSKFRNPDKETVLTPWRVVNMHLGDIIGGWSFLDEGRTETLDEPRFIDRGKVTREVFGKNARILEMNSKSGLYPLYLTYSLYRSRLTKPETEMTLEEAQGVWRGAMDQVFVLCKTDMARSITRRTLAGYNDGWSVNAVYITNLLDRMKDKARLVSSLANPVTWDKGGKKMRFDAIVGNPPYQMSDGGNKASAIPIYQKFVELAISVQPAYISMIMPAKWYSGGRNLDDFRSMMLNDNRLSFLHDYADSSECFNGVDIAGGLCYFLWDINYNGDCTVVNHFNGKEVTTVRNLMDDDVFIRHGQALPIVNKVKEKAGFFYNEKVSPQRPFGLRTYVTPIDNGDIILRYSKGKGPFKRDMVTVANEWIDKWKVITSYLTYDHAGRTDKDGRRRIFSTMEILCPGEICTETYIVIDVFDTKEEAENLKSYLKTRFVRFLVSQVATTQHLSKASFSLVPVQDFSKPWTDQELYEKYNLTEDEIAFIESTIKPME